MRSSIPRVSWGDVRSHVERSLREARRRGDGVHTTLIGPTGRGKTHAALSVLELCPFTLVLAAKPHDPLLSSLRHDGYTTVRSPRELQELPWTPDGEILHPRVLFWPTVSDRRPLEEQTQLQAKAMREALHFAYLSGRWTVLVDEAAWFTEDLRLGRDLRALWVKGRSQGLSLIAATQRPTHIPLYAFSQARFFCLWATRDGRDLERLAEISSGIDRRLIERTLTRLDVSGHEFLFVDGEEGLAGRVVVPPRRERGRRERLKLPTQEVRA